MATKTTILKRILTIGVAVVIGVVIVANFISGKQPPERLPFVEPARAVRVIEVQELPLLVEATGFGTAQPSQSWIAVSNVKGHVVYRNDDLQSGALISEGTLLLEIDPGAYQLALSEIDADIASIDADIAQVNQEIRNTVALFDLEAQRLELSEADLLRTQNLVEANAVAKTQLDVQLRATLAQRQAVQGLVNQQNILPIQLTRLDAQKTRAIARRAQIERDLEDTKIHAPFDMRIGEVNAALYQFVNVGQTLFAGDGVEAAEVNLQFPMASLRRLLQEIPEGVELSSGVLNAEIQLVGEAQMWDAEVVRIANGIDPATRTVRVTLKVVQPENTDNPVGNPPLPKGAYVEGRMSIMANNEMIVLPQETLHEGWIYLVDSDDRLVRRAVDVAYQQNGMAVIDGGLIGGETVVIDDVSPAIDGSLLNPMQDAEMQQNLADTAIGIDR